MKGDRLSKIPTAESLHRFACNRSHDPFAAPNGALAGRPGAQTYSQNLALYHLAVVAPSRSRHDCCSPLWRAPCTVPFNGRAHEPIRLNALPRPLAAIPRIGDGQIRNVPAYAWAIHHHPQLLGSQGTSILARCRGGLRAPSPRVGSRSTCRPGWPAKPDSAQARVFPVP